MGSGTGVRSHNMRLGEVSQGTTTLLVLFIVESLGCTGSAQGGKEYRDKCQSITWHY